MPFHVHAHPVLKNSFYWQVMTCIGNKWIWIKFKFVAMAILRKKEKKQYGTMILHFDHIGYQGSIFVHLKREDLPGYCLICWPICFQLNMSFSMVYNSKIVVLTKSWVMHSYINCGGQKSKGLAITKTMPLVLVTWQIGPIKLIIIMQH